MTNGRGNIFKPKADDEPQPYLMNVVILCVLKQTYYKLVSCFISANKKPPKIYYNFDSSHVARVQKLSTSL